MGAASSHSDSERDCGPVLIDSGKQKQGGPVQLDGAAEGFRSEHELTRYSGAMSTKRP